MLEMSVLGEALPALTGSELRRETACVARMLLWSSRQTTQVLNNPEVGHELLALAERVLAKEGLTLDDLFK